MSLSVVAQGDQLCVISTEHALLGAADVAGGVYALLLDLSALAASDTLEVRIKTKVRATGGGATERTVDLVTYSNAQTNEPHQNLGPYPLHLHAQVSLKQTAGTGRTIPWTLLRVA